MYRNHLEKLTRTRLDDVLVDEGVLDHERLEAAQAEQDQSGRLLSDVLIDSSTIDEWDLAQLVASHYSLPFIDVKLYQIPGPVMELLPLDWCRQQSLLPIDQFGKALGIVCAEVPTPELLDEIVAATGCSPFLYVGVRRAIRDVIDESIKRRGGRTAPAASINGPAASADRPAGARASLTSYVAEAPLPPIDLPHVSLKLNASAAQLIAAAGAAVKRPQIERFGRPAPAPPASLTAPPAKTPSSTGAGASRAAAAAPAPVPVAARAPAPAAPAPKSDDPVRPVLTTRIAPQLPQPAVKKPAPPPQQTGWESIFDSGDSAVRRPDER